MASRPDDDLAVLHDDGLIRYSIALYVASVASAIHASLVACLIRDDAFHYIIWKGRRHSCHNLITDSRHGEHRQRTRRSSPQLRMISFVTNIPPFVTNAWCSSSGRRVRYERKSTRRCRTIDNTKRAYLECLVRCVSLARTLSSPSMSCQCACPNMSGTVDA